MKIKVYVSKLFLSSKLKKDCRIFWKVPCFIFHFFYRKLWPENRPIMPLHSFHVNFPSQYISKENFILNFTHLLKIYLQKSVIWVNPVSSNCNFSLIPSVHSVAPVFLLLFALGWLIALIVVLHDVHRCIWLLRLYQSRARRKYEKCFLANNCTHLLCEEWRTMT